MATKLSDLPDGHLVAFDTETSGTHPDDFGRASIVSWAYRDPADNKVVMRAVPFDQGQDVLTVLRATAKKGEEVPEDLPFSSLPLGPKDLPKVHSKRIRRWIEDHGGEILTAPNLPPSEWGRLLRQLARMRLLGHHLKFDLHMTRTGLRGREHEPPERGGGLDLSAQCVRDTQIAQYVIDPRQTNALKPTSVRLGLGRELGLDEGTEDAEQQALKPWKGNQKDPRFDLIPWKVIRTYAELDAGLTLLLDEYQQGLLEDPAFQLEARHVAREFSLMRTLYGMECRGIGYDAQASARVAGQIDEMCEQLAQRLPFKPTYPGAVKYFFGPEDQGGLGHLPYNDKMTKPSKTHPNGQPQVDEETIERLVSEKVPNADTFARYAELNSAKGKWYQAWADLTGEDGRIRTVFNQTSVVSGRLSVTRFQSQAIPQNYQIPTGLAPVRKLFTSRPGYGLWEADVSQAEIRIATALARCQPMLDQFQQGIDSHSAATWLMFRSVFDREGMTTLQQAEQHPQWDEFRSVAKRAQPLDEPVATPTGWRPIGDLKVGDTVYGPNLDERTVVAIPYEGEDEVWEIETKYGPAGSFRSGHGPAFTMRSCGEHLWPVHAVIPGDHKINLTTAQLRQVLESRNADPSNRREISLWRSSPSGGRRHYPIADVRSTGERVPMRCITVDAEDGLYLTRDYVVTHNCNLGILYGAGATTIRQQIAKFTGIDYPQSQVRQWVDQWRAAFPQFVRFLDNAAEKAARDGWVRLVNGRVRWFSAYEPTHKAANQIIQGSQAEVIKDVVVRIDAEMPGCLLLTIHDSVVCEFPLDQGDAMAQRVTEIMVQEFERTFARPWRRGGSPVLVPFKADVKRWKLAADDAPEVTAV